MEESPARWAAGAAAPAPALRRRENLRSASFRDYAMEAVTPGRWRLLIPDHREIAKGTLRAIIRQAGITVEQFTSLL